MIQGLRTTEARKLLKQYGPNTVAEPAEFSALLDILSRFKDPLLLILIGSALASGFLGDTVTAAIILCIVFASVVIDFVNTYRSQKAAEDLKKRVMVTATVIRDGKETELPFAQIVPGDVVVLRAGGIIPADGILHDTRDVYVNESQLTGESFPVEKDSGAEVLMGSSVITGTGHLIVQKTGKLTKFSAIAESVAGEDEETEFDRSIREFSKLIMFVTLTLVIFIFTVDSLLKHDLFDSFLFAVALAVGLTPELLPMIIALNLSAGSLEMAKRGVIVKRLSAIQNFGNMDILCTDKTGTLTEDKIRLVRCVDHEGKDSDAVLVAGYLSSAFTTGFKSPLDTAIKDFKDVDISAYTKIDEIPFDYTRRKDSVVVSSEQIHRLITKGAPEQIVAVCTSYGSEQSPLTDAMHAVITKQYEELSNGGFRVLGVAQKVLPAEKQIYTKDDEAYMTFLGFIAFLDPPKESAAETLEVLERYGIEIKILTGDNEIITQKIARDIRLAIKGVLMGSEVATLSDSELAERVEQTTIFARVSPDQKQRVISALRARGHVVGYLGDGINDAPPLKAADVGISVENAVDVAKDTADLILLKKSLEDLIEGVAEGRRTFANTMKYLMMSLSSNFGNMFSMAGASALLPFLPMTAPQILLNNLLYDASQFTIPTDRVDESYMLKPRKLKISFIRHFMLVFGALSSVFDFVTFYVLASVFSFNEGAFQTGWFLESMATQTFVIYIIRTRKIPFIESSPSKALLFSTLGSVALAWIIAYIPLGALFGFEQLSMLSVLFIFVITAIYLITVEIVKHWFYRRFSVDD